MAAEAPSPTIAKRKSHTTRAPDVGAGGLAVVSDACSLSAVRIVVSRFSFGGDQRGTSGEGPAAGAFGRAGVGAGGGALAVSSASTAARSAASRSALGGGVAAGRAIVRGGSGSGRLASSVVTQRSRVAPHVQVSVRRKPPPGCGAALGVMPPQPPCARPNCSTSANSLTRCPRRPDLRQGPLDGRDLPAVARGVGVDHDDLRQRRPLALADRHPEVVPRVTSIDRGHALEAAALHELVVEQADGPRLVAPGGIGIAAGPGRVAGLAPPPPLA